MPLVEVRQLVKHYGDVEAVAGVTFHVDRGEVLGFLGPNGAGKSTTMKMVTGFLRPTSGTALVCGRDVLQDPVAVKRSLGYLPESSPSYGEMTVLEFLEFTARVRGLPERGAAALARAVAACHLEAVQNQTIETLSKGFRQRVGLAQAILHDPPVLVLDEPTDGLDPNQKHEVRTLIRSMARDKAVILSTHILEEVDALCTRIIIIARGRIVVDSTPAALRAEHGIDRLDEIFRTLTS